MNILKGSLGTRLKCDGICNVFWILHPEEIGQYTWLN